MTISEIRNLVLQAIYLNDPLSSIMVLKGGSALSLQNLTRRESFDLDFSLLELTLQPDELSHLFKTAVEDFFEEKNFHVFNFTFSEKPRKPIPSQPQDWGGYHLSFKFITNEEYDKLLETTKPNSLSNAMGIAFRNMIGTHEAVKIELSKREYCLGYGTQEIDGIEIKLYTPEMIVIEKLRALCQQMPEYTQRSTKAQRARDFFDIYTVNHGYQITRCMPNKIPYLRDLLHNIFAIKEVPIELLKNIEQSREFHRADFQSVTEVVHHEERRFLRDYDFYVDEVIPIAEWFYTISSNDVG